MDKINAITLPASVDEKLYDLNIRWNTIKEQFNNR